MRCDSRDEAGGNIDPQPLSLIGSFRKSQPWIWRCHIDLTNPHKGLWDFLTGYMLKYDEIVMSSENYFKEDLPVGQRLMFPAINPLSEKNKDISEKTIREHITRAGISTDKPIITQVSRLDPWKDPEGVIEAVSWWNLKTTKVLQSGSYTF